MPSGKFGFSFSGILYKCNLKCSIGFGESWDFDCPLLLFGSILNAGYPHSSTCLKFLSYSKAVFVFNGPICSGQLSFVITSEFTLFA